MNPMPTAPERILVIKLSAIGDVIHTMPAVTAMKKHWPDAAIDWVVEAAAADILKGHPAVDRLLVSERKKWVKQLKNRHFRKESLSCMRAFVRELRQESYDLVFDFHQLLKSGVLVALSRGKKKIGFGPGMAHSEYSYIFLNEPVDAISMEIHALDRTLFLVGTQGVDISDPSYGFTISPESDLAAIRLLKDHGIDPEKPMAAINPVAGWPTKLWTPHGFARTADAVQKELGIQVAFTGGPGDAPYIRDVFSLMKTKTVDLSGRTTLRQLAALYARMRFVVSTDTGPMHLAAAVNTPVFALFGPTAHWRTGPYGKHHAVIRTGISCSPCYKRECRWKDTACMRDITPDGVIDAVQKRYNLTADA